MASILRQLSDADLEAIHNLIRRDAHSDLDIAREAERRLGRAVSGTDQGRIQVIWRYRRGVAYRKWLDRYHQASAQTEARIAEQRQRFEMLRSAIKGDPGSGFEDVSKVILADLAAEIAMMPTGTKIENIKLLEKIVRLVQRQSVINMQGKVMRVEDVATDKSLDEEERRRRIREIFQVEGRK